MKIQDFAISVIPKILKNMVTKTGSSCKIAKTILENEDVVAIPTETVYGLAANAYNEIAVNKIFEIKNRPKNNPLIVHTNSIERIYDFAKSIPEDAITLFKKFSPGPITIILPKKINIPNITTANNNTVAVRIPNHPIALKLLASLNFPLAAPSANIFGYISPTSTKHVLKTLNGKIPYILEGGICNKGIESTIVGFKENKPTIYRQGSITREEIEATIGSVRINCINTIVAPGMYKKHYSPTTPLIYTNDLKSTFHFNTNKRIALITYNQFDNEIPIHDQRLLYTNNNYKQGAFNLYAILHELDEADYDLIIAKQLPLTDLCLSLHDKLIRASTQ